MKVTTMKSIVQRDLSQDFSKVDEEVVMLSLKNGAYYALNKVASRIWELIEKPREVSDIVEILLKEYEVDEDTCARETLNCLNDFKDKSLIK